jgi:TRAP-type mannitol/chloroaromatic compound transport system substrate-binding protein
MLERFSQMVQKLEQSYARFYHVRTQGTLDETEWGDEIHPTKVGFEKIATKIQAGICEEFPTLPKPKL